MVPFFRFQQRVNEYNFCLEMVSLNQEINSRKKSKEACLNLNKLAAFRQ